MVDSRRLKIPIPAIVVPVVVLVLYFIVPGVRQQPWTALRFAGVILAAAGYGLFIAARLQLGKSFSVSPQAKELVTHGLYSRIRNPIYVFVGVMWFGLIAALHLFWLLVPLTLLVILQVVRVRKEAIVLQNRFGQAYLDYRKQTWF
jgi:protein-S-isoprenylcysteine O-methyltransferase Ste14